MLIVWYSIRGEREAVVIPRGVEHVTRYDCQYASGMAAPHYPLPVCDDTAQRYLEWALIRHWPCEACAMNWNDVMESYIQ